MTIAAATVDAGTGRTRSMKLPTAGCRAGIKTVTACSVTAANRATAIVKWQKSRTLQNVLPCITSNIASIATPSPSLAKVRAQKARPHPLQSLRQHREAGQATEHEDQ